MRKNRIFLSLIIVSFFLYTSQLLSADEQSEEVNNLKSTVQIKLDKIKNSNFHELAKDEIKAVENYIETTNNLIKEQEYEKAYYMISIAIVYFNLIDAKKELNISEKELNEIKNKLDK